MTKELVDALLTIVKICASSGDCRKCPFR